VDAVVEGTVYQVGENVRIRVQLIDALPEERNLWAETYERTKTDILVMYNEMARAIAGEIQVKLTAEETKRLTNTRQVNPNYPDVRAYYSHFLFIMHRPDEAMVQIERTMELDPFNPLFLSLYGVDLLFLRRYDDAIEQFQNVLKTVPNNGVALSYLPLLFYQKRMYEKSLETLKAYYTAIGFHEGEKVLTRGYEEAGYTGAMNSDAELWEELSRASYISPYIIADSYVLAANKEQALDWLERSFEVGDPNMPYIGVMLHFVDLLGDEPRYQDLLRRMKLPEGK